VFEKRVRGKVFGDRRDDGMTGCRKIHNEELSPHILRLNKLNCIRWALYVAHVR
jgi:hypothetical protein